ncbi:MAG: biopolymer transporter ExbD [Gemmatimonadales bacterium]
MAGLSGFGRHRRGRTLNAEVNIINLVDVMLVLLIIFMVTAPILQAGIAVQLPDVASKPIPMSDAVVITVERNGAVSIGNERQTFQQFQTSFAIAVAAKHPASVSVRGDTHASYGDVLRVFGVVLASGIKKVDLVTESGP